MPQRADRVVVVGGGILGTLHAWEAVGRGHAVTHIEREAEPRAEAGRGRPYPDLVLYALLATGADDVAAVAVVGDTASDIESGQRAGASIRVGVLTGTHDEATLRAADATHVVTSVRDLGGIVDPGSGGSRR